MRAFGYFLVALGLAILIYQIAGGEVCIGRGGRVCIAYANDPARYWRWFFVYPAFPTVLGLWMIRHQRKPDFTESFVLMVVVGLVSLVGVVVSLLYGG